MSRLKEYKAESYTNEHGHVINVGDIVGYFTVSAGRVRTGAGTYLGYRDTVETQRLYKENWRDITDPKERYDLVKVRYIYNTIVKNDDGSITTLLRHMMFPLKTNSCNCM